MKDRFRLCRLAWGLRVSPTTLQSPHCKLKKITTAAARYEWINARQSPGAFQVTTDSSFNSKKDELTTGSLLTIFSLGLPLVPPAQPVAILFLCKVKDCYLYKVEQEWGGKRLEQHPCIPTQWSCSLQCSMGRQNKAQSQAHTFSSPFPKDIPAAKWGE